MHVWGGASQCLATESESIHRVYLMYTSTMELLPTGCACSTWSHTRWGSVKRFKCWLVMSSFMCPSPIVTVKKKLKRQCDIGCTKWQKVKRYGCLWGHSSKRFPACYNAIRGKFPLKCGYHACSQLHPFQISED